MRGYQLVSEIGILGNRKDGDKISSRVIRGSAGSTHNGADVGGVAPGCCWCWLLVVELRESVPHVMNWGEGSHSYHAGDKGLLPGVGRTARKAVQRLVGVVVDASIVEAKNAAVDPFWRLTPEAGTEPSLSVIL